MNLLTKQKQTHRQENKLMIARGKDREKGYLGSLWLTCTHCYI